MGTVNGNTATAVHAVHCIGLTYAIRLIESSGFLINKACGVVMIGIAKSITVFLIEVIVKDAATEKSSDSNIYSKILLCEEVSSPKSASSLNNSPTMPFHLPFAIVPKFLSLGYLIVQVKFNCALNYEND